MTLMNPWHACAVRVMVLTTWFVCKSLSVYLLHVFCQYVQQQNKTKVPTYHVMDGGGTWYAYAVHFFP